MKYYFPTSTLNFDAIYSCMGIMPPAYHRDEAIWFPRYFKTGVDVSEDVIVLYSCPLKWEVLDEGLVDYPMLVEIDSSIIDSLLRDAAHSARVLLSRGVSCVCSNMPITFKTADLLSGKIKIVFRNRHEHQALESRARVGVSECKFASALVVLNVDIFREGFPADAIEFEVIKTEVLEAVGKSGLKFSHADFVEYEHKDREKGAEVGFLAGKWIHSIQSGYCLDCFKGGLDYDSWKNSLPIEFSNIIDMLCNKIGFRWDVNRSAIVDFCAECWKRCFNTGENMVALEQWHTILQNIARGHNDPTFDYPVNSITDRYMQALACFVGAGKRSNLLAKSIRDDNIVMPELALALHGALVGYSVLSRSLFEKRSYIAETALSTGSGGEVVCRENLPNTPQSQVAMVGTHSKSKDNSQEVVDAMRTEAQLPTWAKRVVDIARKIFTKLNIADKKRSMLESTLLWSLPKCSNESDLIQQIPKKLKDKGWGPQTKVYKELRKALQEGEGDLFTQQQNEYAVSLSVPMETRSGSALLIADNNLVHYLEDFLLKQTGYQEKERAQILKDALYLQREYAPGGRYAEDAKKNPRDNANTIRHLINLINKKNPLSETKRAALFTFLSGRYM